MEQCITDNVNVFTHGHIYFIHRLPEYFKNRYHSLQHKRWNSIRAIISECLSIQEDINNHPYQAKKLEHSLNSQFKALLYWCQNNPLKDHLALKNDLRAIESLLKEEKVDKEAVYHNASALLKRLNRLNIVELVIEYCLLNPKLNYSIIDPLLDTVVSELSFDGLSLTYLEEWYAENIYKSEYIRDLTVEHHRIELLNKIKDIPQSRKTFEVILNGWLPSDYREEVSGSKITRFELIQSNTLPTNKVTFRENSEYGLIKIKVEVRDKYKAIEVAIAEFKNYMEAYKLGQNTDNDVVVGDFCLVKHDKDFEKVRFNIEKKDFENDDREKGDIKQFIQLRKKLGETGIILSDITVIERVLFLVNSSRNLSPENRLLNTWSALEYLLTFFQRQSIIEKVIDVVPKAISLYHIKDKMNVIWLRLEAYKRYSGREQLDEFEAQNLELDTLFNLCGIPDNPHRYDKEKFAIYLTSPDIVKLRDLMARNIHIYKGICELYFLLTNYETSEKTIKAVHELTVHDLTQIYRIRNKIVHSGKTTTEDMEVVVAKLNRYLNGLVGTLIHYLDWHPGLRISEILYSIEQTYNWYIKELPNKTLAPVKVASPPYLFL